MGIMMALLMDTSQDEGLAATMALLLAIQKVVTMPFVVIAASLLLYLIIISKLILSIVNNMIKTIVSLFINCIIII
jgi:hypothetical protein